MIIFQSIIQSIIKGKRICPHCHKKQSVPVGKEDEFVRCKFCGAEIPPEKPSGSTTDAV